MERQWYYVIGGKEKAGPISETELRQRIQTGQVQPADLVWSEGMGNWEAASQVPSLMGGGGAPSPAPAAAYSPVQAPYGAAAAGGYGGDAIPEGLLGWTKFVGVMNIIAGVLTCLTCIGIPIGIMLIVAGNALLGSKNVLETSGATAAALPSYLQNIKKFMLMQGIMYILYIVLFALQIAFYIFVFSQGVMSLGDFAP
jgi:hypothetical protein